MSITDRARAEAEGRFGTDDYPGPTTLLHERLRRDAFIAGAEWAMPYTPTDSMLEAVARAIYEDRDEHPDWTDAPEQTRIEYRGNACAALTAAREAQR